MPVNLYSDSPLMTDIGGTTPALFLLALAAVSGTAVLKGYFVDINGQQVGASMSGNITTTPTTLTAWYNAAQSIAAGTPLPSNFAGFEGVLSGSALNYGKSGQPNGTVGQDSGAGAMAVNYPQVAISTQISFGRVG